MRKKTKWKVKNKKEVIIVRKKWRENKNYKGSNEMEIKDVENCIRYMKEKKKKRE